MRIGRGGGPSAVEMTDAFNTLMADDNVFAERSVDTLLAGLMTEKCCDLRCLQRAAVYSPSETKRMLEEGA